MNAFLKKRKTKALTEDRDLSFSGLEILLWSAQEGCVKTDLEVKS